MCQEVRELYIINFITEELPGAKKERIGSTFLAKVMFGRNYLYTRIAHAGQSTIEDVFSFYTVHSVIIP